MKSVYGFSVHAYAPELNQIFCNGKDVTHLFASIKRELKNNYQDNIRLVRKRLNYKTFNHYIDIVYKTKTSTKNPHGGFNNYSELQSTLRYLDNYFNSGLPEKLIMFKFKI